MVTIQHPSGLTVVRRAPGEVGKKKQNKARKKKQDNKNLAAARKIFQRHKFSRLSTEQRKGIRNAAQEHYLGVGAKALPKRRPRVNPWMAAIRDVEKEQRQKAEERPWVAFIKAVDTEEEEKKVVAFAKAVAFVKDLKAVAMEVVKAGEQEEMPARSDLE